MVDINEALANPLDEKNFHLIKSSLYNSKGVSYHEFKKTLKPSYKTIWIEILSGYFFLIALVLAGAFAINSIESTWFKILFMITDALLIGFVVTYLINFFHEAAHYNISPSKNSNDLWANVFLGVLQSQGIKHYRIVHWQHHVHIGETEDTERSYFEALTPVFFIESLTGIRLLQIILFRNKNVRDKKNNKATADVIREGKLMLLAGLLFHTFMLLVFALTKQFWLIPTWILSFGTFFPFFSSLRQLLEHRSEIADKRNDYSKIPHGKLTRIFNSNFIASKFGSAGFTRHLLHHLEPQISYTNLKQLECFLQDTVIGPRLKKQKTSYFKVFVALLGK